MPPPTNYVTRSALGWGPTGAAPADPKSGLVIHYDSVDQDLAHKDHEECLAYWHRTRRFHMDGRGWADVGYSFMSCAHGYVLEGRGLYREQAAQKGGNRSHYSCTLATGPGDTITPEQINAVRALRQWLMEPDTSIAGTVLGHRDFNPTSCPGDTAYALVQDGTFSAPPGAITPISEEDPLIGLREGDGIPDPHEGVKAIQRLIVQSGQAAALEPYGVDGQWGGGTSEALMLVRQSVGSGVTEPVTYMNGETYGQLLTAMARDQARRFGPSCDCDTSGTGATALEGATLTAKVTGVQS